VERIAPRDQITAAAVVVEQMVPDDQAGEAAMRETLAGKYTVVRPDSYSAPTRPSAGSPSSATGTAS